MMQTIFLGVQTGPNVEINGISYRKSQIPINKKTLLELVYEKFSNSSNIIALDSADTNLFRDHEFEKTKIVEIRNRTKGALGTLGMLLDELDPVLPILVVPTDSFISNSRGLIDSLAQNQTLDASIITFYETSKIFSYARIIENEVVEISEKNPISRNALAGIFYFRDTSVLKKAIEWSLVNKVTLNGLYYVAPAINALIANGLTIGVHKIERSEYFRFSDSESADQNLRRFNEQAEH